MMLKLKRVGEARMRNPFVLSRFAETVRTDVGGTSNLLRDTGNGDDMNLEEVTGDLKNAREILGPSRQGPWWE